MISVVVPAYNSKQTIADCLDSIFKSEYKDFEVIVVDDGSTDGTGSIAGQFPAKIVKLEKNRGAGYARNRGVEAAKADIILFIDSDCILASNALSLLAQTFESETADAVVGSYSIGGSPNDFYSKFQNLFTYQSHDIPEGQIFWFWTACGAIRKQVFEKIGGFVETYSGASAEDMKIGTELVMGNHKIILNKKIQVTHKHRFGFVSVLENDFRKSRDFTVLVLSTDHDFKHKSTSFKNFLIVLTAYTVLASAVLTTLGTLNFLLFALLSAIYIRLNADLYKLNLKQEGVLFLILSGLFHFVVSIVIGFGAFAGLLEHTLSEREKNR